MEKKLNSGRKSQPKLSDVTIFIKNNYGAFRNVRKPV